MTKRWIWILFLLLLVPASAFASPPQSGVAAAPDKTASASVADFLNSLGAPGALPTANSCPASFCTADQKYQCHVVTCHNHGIGLVCDFSNCTSQCICGSILPG